MALIEWAVLVGGLTLIAMGLRHALDVDHITAIDNLIRFNNASKRSRWVGTGFSAGHMVSVLAEMIAMVYVAASIIDQGGVFSLSTGIIGAAALGFIGIVNFYAMKKYGKTSATILVGKILPRTKHMGAMGSSFVVGIVFGLGFDTATQLAALGMSAAASVIGGIETALVMIAVFGVGMVAMDTMDSVLFRAAFIKTLGTKGFRYLSYALSSVALIIATTSTLESVYNITIVPELTGPVLAVSVLVCTFVYARYRKNKEPQPESIPHEH
jgi:nickel/cobalt transporter (NiCoT) family protein